MSKDLLAEATRALRETESVSEFEARATRARVMTGLHQTRVRRRTRWAFLLPIAASFVAVSAWGAASGQARVVLERLERYIGVTPRPPAQTNLTPRKTLARPALSTASEPTAHVASPEVQLAPAPPAAAAETVPARPAPSTSASAARAERIDPALSLYRVAHTAHFVDRDPARALAAWDAYLRAAPRGQFAPEARYNRALSLVRLGRNQEARSALEPFANGDYGGYRQADARALVERIAP